MVKISEHHLECGFGGHQPSNGNMPASLKRSRTLSTTCEFEAERTANDLGNAEGAEWAAIACIEPSPFDAGTAYVVAENHRLDDMRPYLFKTADFGKTWALWGPGSLHITL